MRVGKVRASDPDSSGRVLGSSPRGGAKATQMRGFFYFLTFLSFISWGILFISSILKVLTNTTLEKQNQFKID